MTVVVVVTLPAIFAIISLAVDFGRVQVAKAELQAAVDAAALHAATVLDGELNAVRAAAVAAANDNYADGSRVALSSSLDVELGVWDGSARTFTPLTGNPAAKGTAVRVTGRRTSARGNPVPLVFGQLIGVVSADVVCSAVAIPKSAADPYPIVGLNFIESESNATSRIDSYNSNDGAYSPERARHNARVASNGDIKLRNGTTVYGNAHPGIGKRFTHNPTVTGSKANLTKPLDYPRASGGNVATQNDNGRVSPVHLDSNRNFLLQGTQTYTLPAGTYYFNRFQVLNSARLTFSGPVTIYCTDRVDIDSTINTHENLPRNFKLISLSNVTKPSDCEIEIERVGNVYMDIYAPQCEVDIEDNVQYHGYVVGGSLEISENAFVHYDEASGTPSGSIRLAASLVN